MIGKDVDVPVCKSCNHSEDRHICHLIVPHDLKQTAVVCAEVLDMYSNPNISARQTAASCNVRGTINPIRRTFSNDLVPPPISAQLRRVSKSK